MINRCLTDQRRRWLPLYGWTFKTPRELVLLPLSAHVEQSQFLITAYASPSVCAPDFASTRLIWVLTVDSSMKGQAPGGGAAGVLRFEG
jgi:hypothetical protein